MNAKIKELWNGTLSPKASCGASDPELAQLVRLAERNKHRLYAELTPSQIELFEKYLDCSEEALYLAAMHAFSDGFCLGVQLLTEALT